MVDQMADYWAEKLADAKAVMMADWWAYSWAELSDEMTVDCLVY